MKNTAPIYDMAEHLSRYESPPLAFNSSIIRRVSLAGAERNNLEPLVVAARPTERAILQARSRERAAC